MQQKELMAGEGFYLFANAWHCTCYDREAGRQATLAVTGGEIDIV